MTPTSLSFIAILAVASGASFSWAANYSSISNKDEIIVPEDGDIIVNNTNHLGRGVGWTSGSGTTELHGNIDITSVTHGVTIFTDAGNAHILLKTVKDTDSIVIKSTNVSSSGGVVYSGTKAVGSTITLDASASSDNTVYIISEPEYGGAPGVRGEAGEIKVIGNLDITSVNSGIGTSTSDLDKSRAVVHVTGNYTVNSSNGVGLDARNHSTITIDGNADITSKDMGIYSFVGCTVTVGGSLGITADRGIEATNGKVVLNGIHAMNLRYSTASAIDVGSNNEGHVGTVIGNAGVYKFSGKMSASKDGLIDIDMRQDSHYTGYTKFDASAPGTINIALSDTSIWTLTQDSVMTDLTVNATSAVEFTISGQNDFTDLTLATLTLASGSIITVNFQDYNPVLYDEFQLIIADTYDVEDGIIYQLGDLDEGLYWDTTDFATTGTIRVAGEQKNIPEPSVPVILLTGILGMAWKRRRN